MYLIEGYMVLLSGKQPQHGKQAGASILSVLYESTYIL